MTWTTVGGRRLKIHSAGQPGVTSDGPALAPGHLDGVVVGTGEGRIELIEVQPEGRATMPAAAWRNGLGSGVTDVTFGRGPVPG